MDKIKKIETIGNTEEREKKLKQLEEKQLEEFTKKLNKYIIKHYGSDVSHIITNGLKIESLLGEDRFRLELKLPFWNIRYYKSFNYRLEYDDINMIERIFKNLSDDVFPKIKEKEKEKEEKIEKLEKQFLEVSKFILDNNYKRNMCNASVVESDILYYWEARQYELHEELQRLTGKSKEKR